MAQTTIPFSNLSPDLILDAIDSVGITTDGRLLALNSYENRVYQAGVEDASPIVAKFYRPHRWDDVAILEEHAFVQSLADAEIPAVAPSSIDGKTLFTYQDFRFSIFPKHGGRAPELDQAGVLEWIGRFIGRIHSVGSLSDFKNRPTLSIETFGAEPSTYLLNEGMMPKELEVVYRGVVAQALDGVRRCYDRAGDVAMLRLHGDCHMGNLLWTDAGPHLLLRGIRPSGEITPSLCESRIPRIYKTLAKRAQLSENIVAGISGHSMRVGAAQDLLIQGASLPQIMVKGGWSKTETVIRYTERLPQYITYRLFLKKSS